MILFRNEISEEEIIFIFALHAHYWLLVDLISSRQKRLLACLLDAIFRILAKVGNTP